MTESSSQQIDLEQIIRARIGSKRLYIPKFAINLLKNFIHQDFINSYLKQGYEGVPFCDNCLKYLGVHVEVQGLENLDALNGKYTIVSNHPLGAIDGVALGKIFGQHFHGEVRYIVNDLLMSLKGLAPLCVPVNKLGHQARNLPKLIDEAFVSQKQIIMFPAGICSRRIDGQIKDLPWSKAFITKSIQSKRDIVPVRFIGRNSDRFYNVAQWCKRLGIKFNLAMLFLPDEMYRSRGSSYKVIVGKPIPWETFTNAKTPTEWAQEVRGKVYELKETEYGKHNRSYRKSSSESRIDSGQKTQRYQQRA